jgi:hypothetical protein
MKQWLERINNVRTAYRFNNQPALYAGVANIIFALALALGFELDGVEVAAAMSIVSGVLALLVRKSVWGPKSVDEIMDASAVIEAAERR